MKNGGLMWNGPLGRWKSPLWKTIRRSMWRPGHSVRCNGWKSSDCCEGVKAPPLWWESFTSEHASDMHWSRGEVGKVTSWLQTLRSWDNWTRQKSILEGSKQITCQGCFNISCSQSQTAQQNCLDEIMKSENHRKSSMILQRVKISEEEFQVNGEVSTSRNTRWLWSLCRLLVDPRWFHLSSSQWTSSSTLCAERRIIPNSTEVYWRLLERRRGSKFVRLMERIHEVHFIERKTTRRMLWSTGRLTKIQVTTRLD